MFSYKTHIGYSEVSPEGVLKIPSLMSMLQDCCMNHSASLGLDIDHYQAKHWGWLLSSWQVVIEKLPKYPDEVLVETRPYDFKGFYGMRNFRVESAQGDTIVKANSIWFLYDFEKGRPIKCPEEEINAYGIDEKLEMDYAPRRMALPEDFCDEEEIFVVTESVLDNNKHMNNVQYIRVAYEELQKIGVKINSPGKVIEDAGFYPTVKEIRAEYKKSAVYLDEIHFKSKVTEDTTFIDLVNKDNESFATVSFRFK